MNYLKSKYVQKGWGHEEWLVNNDLYCGKLLYVHKGKRCSLHYHKIKDETFYIQSGRILFDYLNDYEDFVSENYLHQNHLFEGQIIHIPVRFLHRFTAIENSVIVEFSTHHEDSDSYRLIKGD